MLLRWLLVKLLHVWAKGRGCSAWSGVYMPTPVIDHNTAIKLVPRPGTRLWSGAGCVGTTVALRCAFIDGHIHGLLLNDWGTSLRVLRGDRGGTGLAIIRLLGVSAALVGWVWKLLLGVVGVGLCQSGLEALDIRLFVHGDSLGGRF